MAKRYSNVSPLPKLQSVLGRLECESRLYFVLAIGITHNLYVLSSIAKVEASEGDDSDNDVVEIPKSVSMSVVVRFICLI